MSIFDFIRNYAESLITLFFPSECLVCKTSFSHSEKCICTSCHIDLPRTHYHLQPNNPTEQLFWGRIPLERASAYFFYRKGSNYRHLLYQLKYGGKKNVGFDMGRHMAAELLASEFFKGIDVMLPVPLHKKRQKERGYNQSEWIARGIASLTGIPIECKAIVRSVYTETQTHQQLYERWENVEGIFEVHEPEKLIGKHVLLIDDVLTTGSTIAACALPLTNIEGVRISILTLALATI